MSSPSSSTTGQQLFDCRDANMKAVEEMAAADARVRAVAEALGRYLGSQTYRHSRPASLPPLP